MTEDYQIDTSAIDKLSESEIALADRCYAPILKKILSTVQNGEIVPWHSMLPDGLTPYIAAPNNPVTQRHYTGSNRLQLVLDSALNKTGDNKYATLRQWNQVGYRVNRGETGKLVLLFSKNYRAIVRGENGSPMLDSDGKKQYQDVEYPRHYARSYSVFGRSQVSPIDERKDPYRLREVKVMNADTASAISQEVTKNLCAGLGVEVIDGTSQPAVHDLLREKGSAGAYSKSGDYIMVPTHEAFSDPNQRHSVIIHEAMHATGHKDRLKRDTLYSSEDNLAARAREEIRVEMATWLFCITNEVPHNQKNSEAYIKHWAGLLKDNPKEFLLTIKDVTQATTYAQKALEKGRNKVREQSKPVAQEAAITH